MESPVFLTKSQVLFIHQDLVEDFGGSHGPVFVKIVAE